MGDSTSASVVNVILRNEGVGLQSRRRNFFLESVYTSHKKFGADAYVRTVESVVETLGGCIACGL